MEIASTAVLLLTGATGTIELLEVPMTSRQGTADAERLGVMPKPMRAVLGVG